MSKRGGKIRLRKAMTLLELVIAMAMIGIIFAAILPQFAIIRNSWDSKQGSAEAMQNGRVLMDHINRNLSKAARITAVSGSLVTSGYIEFADADGDVNRYDVAANKYVEFGPQPGTLSDLAGPVSSFTFTCYSACDLNTPITDPNIRVVKVDANVTNVVSPGQDKTFTTWATLRSNGNNPAGLTKKTLYEFDNSDGQYPALAQIDSTRYLCAYSRSNNGYAVVLTVNPSTWAITWGTRVSLENPAARGLYPALARIDSAHYLCAYTGNTSATNYGYAVVLTVSGTTITRGTRYSLESSAAAGYYPALAKIDDTHYLCAYAGAASNYYGYAEVLTVSGTTITPGARYSLEATATTGRYPALVQIDAGRYLCAYTRGSSRGYAVVLTVSGTTITPGTRASLETPVANGLYPALAQIDSTHYLCAYTGGSSRGYAKVLTVSGTTVTPGTTRYSLETPAATGLYPALAQMIDLVRGKYSFLCSYRGPSNRAWAVVLNVNTSGWTILAETPLQYDTASTWPALAKINDGSCSDDWRYLCAYTGPSNDGWSVVLNYTELKP